MALLLGIDFGTSYFKVGLFDAAGVMRGLGRVRVEKESPRPALCELPVPQFWQLLQAALAQALEQAEAKAGDIVGLSYSSQANTLVLLDRCDRPLTPLVIWNDRRAHPVEPTIARFGGSREFHLATGFAGLAAEFAPVKCRWFQAQEPAVWVRAARVMTLPDYFTLSLTGEAAVDTSTSALSGLLSVATGEWWLPALRFFRIASSALSRPLLPGTVCGKTLPQAQALLGVHAGVPMAIGGLDHYMAAIGSGLGRLGQASISTGTVLAALQLVDRVQPKADCYHGPHFAGGFYRLAFDPAGANQLEDYQRNSAPDLTIAELAALAATVAPGTSPGPAESLPRRHGILVRDLMERISGTHHALLQRLQATRLPTRVIATGGGARSSEWLQIKADVLGTTIVAPKCHERACLGAAAFAAAAAGVHPRVSDALQAMVHSDRVVEPQEASRGIYGRWRPAKF